MEKGSLLASLIGPRAVNIFLNLPQTIEFMRHCKLVISVDSGNIHLASAAGTPSIGLFAAIYLKGQWYPFGNRNIVLRKELECHSCFNPYCAQSHCLDGVSVEEVLTAAGKILNNDYGEVKDAKS